MSKKDFRGPLDHLLQPPTDPGPRAELKRRGRPQTSTKVVTRTPEDGTREGETRATFIVNKELLQAVKDIASQESYRLTVANKHTTTVMIKDVVREALQEYLERYEKKHGKNKPTNK